MSNREGKSNNDSSKSKDFYQVLGLTKECSPSELRHAYKKLALRWHPDRCASPGNSKAADEAKKKFQAIQQAYSVLSDTNKRFLYDVGAYDSDEDDDDNGMGEFLNEMADMMRQAKPNENREESLEELQELFEEMFQEDIESFGANGYNATSCSTTYSYGGSYSFGNQRNHPEIHAGTDEEAGHCSGFESQFHSARFCPGTSGTKVRNQNGEGSKRRNSRSGRQR